MSLKIECTDLAILGESDRFVDSSLVPVFLAKWKTFNETEQKKFLELHEARAIKIRQVGIGYDSV